MKSGFSGRARLIHAVGILCVIFVAVGIALTPGVMDDESYSPALYASVWALLPPVVAITLALVTKEVYSSLFLGILVGAFLYAGGNGEKALTTLLFHEEGGLVTGITDFSHASILVFVTLLGTLVVMMNRSGGAAAFGRWAKAKIKTRVGAELATMLMGLLIFVDDGFNCMTVGSVMRPITDSHKVSRAKLAYLLDATAAPVCIIAPISCWAAAVSYAVPAEYEINGFSMFIRTIPYNFYALGTLFMLLCVTLWRLDFGAMRIHEQNALNGDLFTTADRPYGDQEKEETAPEDVKNGKISNLVIPVVTLIVCCILGMGYTGGLFSGAGIRDAFADADSARGLVMGTLIATLVTFWLYMSRNVMTFKDFMESFAAGFRSMCAPMIILILSWNLSGMTGLLGAASFIQRVMESSAAELTMFVPAIVFIVSVFLAFSTGTSWGTFTILIPIVCAVFPTDSEMLVIAIAACLAGAVCGDHCSPISDTTIMASAGAHSDHINHVTTQLPYALTVAGASAVGYLLSGVIGYQTGNALAVLGLPLTFAATFGFVLFMKRRKAEK